MKRGALHLRPERLTDFPQQKLDFIVGELRKRGNSNATINRKLAALRKLLKKAMKMASFAAFPNSAG